MMSDEKSAVCSVSGKVLEEHAIETIIERSNNTQSHIEYVVEVILDVWRKREHSALRNNHQAKFLAALFGPAKTVAAEAYEVTIDPKLKRSAREQRWAA